MGTTTIQISKDLLDRLKERKMYDKESYGDIIWDLLEDSMELSEETKKHIKQAETDIRAGRTVPLATIKKNMGL